MKGKNKNAYGFWLKKKKLNKYKTGMDYLIILILLFPSPLIFQIKGYVPCECGKTIGVL
jgi:hypothetical protein